MNKLKKLFRLNELNNNNIRSNHKLLFMKKKYLSVGLVLVLATSILSTSCIGSFKLTNNVLNWNHSVGNKFVNELVFFAFWVLPVYEITILADAIVINSVEFWSGSNPIAQGSSIIEGNDGKYLVECDSKGYTITSMNNKKDVVRFDFDVDNQTWSLSVEDQTYPLMTFVDENHVKMIMPDGSMQLVEKNQAGLLAYQKIASGSFFAMK